MTRKGRLPCSRVSSAKKRAPARSPTTTRSAVCAGRCGIICWVRTVHDREDQDGPACNQTAHFRRVSGVELQRALRVGRWATGRTGAFEAFPQLELRADSQRTGPQLQLWKGLEG